MDPCGGAVVLKRVKSVSAATDDNIMLKMRDRELDGTYGICIRDNSELVQSVYKSGYRV